MNKKEENQNVLVSIIGKLLYENQLSLDLISSLSKHQKEILIMFLFKRKMISSSICEKSLNHLNENIMLISLLSKVQKNSKCNFFTLFEMILNKILRQAFDTWIKEMENEKNSNSERILNKLSNKRSNIDFWRFLHKSSSSSKNVCIENLYNLIKSKFQIKRKIIKKKDNDFSKRKIKYMNLELNKELRKKILDLLSDCPPFQKLYAQFKSTIVKEYEQFKMTYSFMPIKLDVSPYEINVKNLIKQSLNGLIDYRKNLKKTLKIEDMEQMMKDLRNLKLPVSFNDYNKVFKIFEQNDILNLN